MAYLEATFEDLGIVTVDDAELHVSDKEEIETEEVDVIYYETSSSPVQLSAFAEVPVSDPKETDENRVRRKVRGIVNQFEKVIERFRAEALRLDEDKEAILSSLDSLKHSDELYSLPKDELCELKQGIHMMMDRLQSIDIRIMTSRSTAEEEALYHVNGFIDNLVMNFRDEPINTLTACTAYLRSCDGIFEGQRDMNFEAAIRECCKDDRKRVRRRLQGLLDYVNSWQKNVQLELLE